MKNKVDEQNAQNGDGKKGDLKEPRFRVVTGFITSINIEQREVVMETKDHQVIIMPIDLPHLGLEIVGEKVLLAKPTLPRKKFVQEEQIAVLIEGNRPKGWTEEAKRREVLGYAQYRYRISHEGNAVTNGYLTILQLIEKVVADGVDSIPEDAIWARIGGRQGVSQFPERCEPIDFSLFLEVSSPELRLLEGELAGVFASAQRS